MGQFSEFDGDRVAIRVCPRCEKAFYALGTQGATCSFCGKPVTERRGGDRIRTKVRFLANMIDSLVSARVEDYSLTGIKLAYQGRALDANAIVELDISELALKVKARAVWSRTLEGDRSYTGFAFIQHEKERFFAQ